MDLQHSLSSVLNRRLTGHPFLLSSHLYLPSQVFSPSPHFSSFLFVLTLPWLSGCNPKKANPLYSCSLLLYPRLSARHINIQPASSAIRIIVWNFANSFKLAPRCKPNPGVQYYVVFNRLLSIDLATDAHHLFLSRLLRHAGRSYTNHSKPGHPDLTTQTWSPRPGHPNLITQT